ncbi:MAG: YqhA family protein [Anaerolineales bacterium]
MSRILGATRYLVVIPVIGLAIAASLFFVFGGIGLIRLLIELSITAIRNLTQETVGADRGLVIFEVVEFVHLFLVGTVLYITAIGLYQLFINEIKFPNWLKIDSTEELETNLIGVTVVVLAVNFMGAVFVGGKENLLEFGAGIALPIAALGVFLGLRAWSTKLNKETPGTESIETASKELAIPQEHTQK